MTRVREYPMLTIGPYWHAIICVGSMVPLQSIAELLIWSETYSLPKKLDEIAYVF